MEIFVVRLLPFTYLKLHHAIFREIVFHLIAIGAAWGVIALLNLQKEELGWLKPKPRTLLTALALGTACWVLVTMGSVYLWIAKKWLFFKDPRPETYLILITWPEHFKIWLTGIFTLPNIHDIFPYLNSFIAAPIVEELIFRGVIFAALSRKFNLTWAIGITSALDLLLHYNLPGFFFSANWRPEDTQALFYLPRFLQLAVFSVAAGWLRSRKATLPSLSIFHASYNFLASSILWDIIIPQ